jgi:UDP-2,3-diacylglucosamine pyrophosphatase LpxH
MTQKKRKVELIVISDVHLGTYGCKAKELLTYLRSVKPKTLILNGDIIDIWQFKKSYFPNSHMKVLKEITNLLSKKTKVYYITGNHDEMLRKFVGFKLGGFEIVNKLVLELDNKKAWFFHGDVFDVTMKHSKWIAKLGGHGYDLLILLNTFSNWISQKLGRGKLSFSKKIKNSVKGAVKYISNFEETAAQIGSDNHYDYVVCGHIHQPQIKNFEFSNRKKVMYLNSGDWVENQTALEYNKGHWSVFNFIEQKTPVRYLEPDEEMITSKMETKQLFNKLIEEFELLKYKSSR